MKRFARIAGRAAYTLAWALVLVALVLFAIERGPWLKNAVRARLSDELGVLGSSLTVGDVRLHWFRPAVELRDVRIEDRGGELVLDSVYVALEPRRLLQGEARFVRVEGGLIELYESLGDDVRRVLRSREAAAGPIAVPRAALASEPPPILIERVRVALVTPTAGRLPLGEVNARLEFPAAGPLLSGEVLPGFRARGSDASIYFRGQVSGELLSLHADSPGIELSLEGEAYAELRELLPVSDPRGLLRLSSTVQLARDGSAPPRGELELSLEGASFSPEPPLPSVEDLRFAFSASFEPAERQGFFTPDAWTAVGHFEGRSLDTPVSGWVRAGRGLGGAVATGQARAASFPVGREVVDALRANLGDTLAVREVERYWSMFRPEGRVDLAVAVRVGALTDGPERWQMAADVALDGVERAAWHGEEIHGGGIPMPASPLSGRAVFVRAPGEPVPDRFALVGLRGELASGHVLADGLVCTAPDPRFGPEVEFEVRVPRVAIEGPLLGHLLEHKATATVPALYGPESGLGEALIRIESGPETRGLVAALDIAVHAATAKWAGLPVPLRDVEGVLTVRWGRTPLFSELSSGRLRILRPVGVRFLGDGRFGTGGEQRAAVDVRWREEAPEVWDGGRLPSALSVDVALDHVLLRGEDWETIVATLPAVRLQAESFNPRGWGDVEFHHAEAWPGAPALWQAEFTPGALEVVPDLFPRPTTDVHGRVLVRARERADASSNGMRARDSADASSNGMRARDSADAASNGAAPAQAVDTRVDLAGSWLQSSGPVDVAASVSVPGDGRGRAEVFGAGVDPSNTSLLGSLKEAMTADGGGAGLDLTALAVQGLLDFRGEIPISVGTGRGQAGPAKDVLYEVCLRDNDLIAGQFALTRMRGVLVQKDGVLFGERIDALLASTPVRLEQARFLGTDDLSRLGAARRVLEEMSLPSEPGGYLLTATISAEAPLPMDRDHLGLFFAEDELARVLDRTRLSGAMRFEGATFVFTGDGLGSGKIAVGGPVSVEDVHMVLGLPLVIERGDLLIHGLVFEAGRVRGWVDLDGVRGSIADRSIRDASMMLTYIDGRLSIDRLDAQFDFGGDFDGRLTSLGGRTGGGLALALDLGEPYRFELNVELQRVVLDGLLRGLFDTGLSEPGRLNATLSLSGSPTRLSDVTGNGSLRLEEARLWSIPVARELFSTLGFDDTATFQEMSARFEIEDGVIRLSEMLAKSPLAKLVGGGTLNVDGTVHVDMEVRYTLVDRLGPLNRILYWIQNSLIRVAIRGDLERPFVILRNAIAETFNGFEDHPRALPLPPLTELPERF